MKHWDESTKKQFINICKVNVILTVIENIGFLLLGHWDYSVLAGSLLGLGMTTLFFYSINVSVQKALGYGDPDMAQKSIRASGTGRTLMMAVGIFIAIKVPAINWIAAVIPLVFTRISIMVLHLDPKGEEE